MDSNEIISVYYPCKQKHGTSIVYDSDFYEWIYEILINHQPINVSISDHSNVQKIRLRLFWINVFVYILPILFQETDYLWNDGHLCYRFTWCGAIDPHVCIT